MPLRRMSTPLKNDHLDIPMEKHVILLEMRLRDVINTTYPIQEVCLVNIEIRFILTRNFIFSYLKF